jgi:hypothetical protein
MNFFVILFFLSNVVATLVLGSKFASHKNDKIFRGFGMALLLDAAAFLVWTLGLIQPAIMLTCVTIGTIIFLVSLIFMVDASAQEARKNYTRWLFTGSSIVIAFGIFLVGRYTYLDNYAYISEEGLLFFNLGPVVQMLYVFALTLATLPVLNLVARKFEKPFSLVVQYGFIIEIVGGIILVTSNDFMAVYITGWVMAVSYLIMWILLVFSKKAWEKIN